MGLGLDTHGIPIQITSADTGHGNSGVDKTCRDYSRLSKPDQTVSTTILGVVLEQNHFVRWF